MRATVLLRGGRVVDPSQGYANLLDVAVLDGRIARVAAGGDDGRVIGEVDPDGRSGLGRQNLVVARQVDAKFGKPRAESPDILELRDFRVTVHALDFFCFGWGSVAAGVSITPAGPKSLTSAGNLNQIIAKRRA